MKFTCTKSNFLKGLSLVERIPSRNTSLPIIENIFLRAGDHKLSFISTDLELGVISWVPAKIESDGEGVFPLKLISNLFQSLEDSNIEGQLQKNSLVLKCGAVNSRINGEDPSQFPIFPTFPKENPVKLPAYQISKALGAVQNACANTDIKPEISGIFVSITPKEITLAATDSFRLAERKISGPFLVQEPIRFILPLKAAAEIVRIINSEEKDAELLCFLKESQIFFSYSHKGESSIPDFFMVSRLIEGEYPDYQQIIPSKFTTLLSCSRPELVQTLKSASVFTNRLREVVLTVSPTKKEVFVETQDNDKGEYTSHIAGQGSGESVRVTLNYQYLLEGLQSLDSERVTLNIEDKHKPILIFPESGASLHKYIVMPIRKD